MARIRSKVTKPEVALRRIVYRLGYRYRLHNQKLPGRPDVVFRGRKKVIFVHGCFWHAHQNCKIAHVPRSRLRYWRPKLERTRARDGRNRAELENLGWKCLTVWECELVNPHAIEKRVTRFLDSA
ncbi:MAG: very short patch repair endonuclease [Blastocatellia bacterium]